MVYSALSDSTTTSQFTRRKKIHINSSADGALTDYPIKLTIAHEAAMQADFDDVRFSELDGSYIYHWLESKTDSSTADIWIKTDVPASGGTDIYIYYGNSSLSCADDIDNTFEFGDDFGGSPILKYTVSAETGAFESYGFIFEVSSGTLMHIYTAGTQHDYETVRKVVKRTSTDGGVTWSSQSDIYNDGYDDRNLGGGISSTGAIIIFMSRYNDTCHQLSYIRSTDGGSSWSSITNMPNETCTDCSPHGQLVEVPGKGLMQSYYIGTTPYKVKVIWSYDDGATWEDNQDVFSHATTRLNECSFQYIGDSKIIGFSRREDGTQIIHQFMSSNNGADWSNLSTGMAEHQGPVWCQYYTHNSIGMLLLIYMEATHPNLAYRTATASTVFADATEWQSSTECILESSGLYESIYYNDSYPIFKVVFQNDTDKHLYIDFLDVTTDNTVDTVKWNTSGTVTQSGGEIVGQISSKSLYGSGYAARTRVNNPNCVASAKYMAGWADEISMTNWIFYRTHDTEWAKEEYDGGITTTDLSISADTSYHIFDIGKITGTAYFNRDGTGDGTLATGAIANADRITNYSSDTVIDWCVVRKYTINEPTIESYGTEQHQRTIPLILYSSTVLDGWVGTVNGVTNPAKINGIAVANISKVNGVS